MDGGIAELGMGGPSGQERSFNLNTCKERVGIEPIEAWWQCSCTEGGLAGLVDELLGDGTLSRRRRIPSFKKWTATETSSVSRATFRGLDRVEGRVQGCLR